MRYLKGLVLALGMAAVAAAPLAAQAQPAPAYDGLKKTVSVDTFVVTDAVGPGGTAEGMTAMLTDALSRDGRFVVVERTGSDDPSGALAASAVIRAAVTKFDANAGGGNLGSAACPWGRSSPPGPGSRTRRR